jgi:DNA-3-methyladenine glycosylase I
MSTDVIIGHDGKPRCVWAGTGDSDLGRYHDEVWGTRTHDEALCSRRSPWACSRSG